MAKRKNEIDPLGNPQAAGAAAVAPLAVAPVASSALTAPPAGWGGPTTGVIGNPAGTLRAKQAKAAQAAAAAAAQRASGGGGVGYLTPEQQIEFNQSQIERSRTPQVQSPATAMPGAAPAQVPQTPQNPATLGATQTPGPSGVPPIKPAAAVQSEFIPGPEGPLLRGTDGTPLRWQQDPVTNANIPFAEGLTNEQFDTALTKDQRYVADEVLTTLPGPVGDDFRGLATRRDAIQSAQNLRADQRRRELDLIDQEWSQKRYSALMSPEPIIRARQLEARKAQRESADTDAAIQQAATEQSRESQRMEQESYRSHYAEAERELSTPFHSPSADEIAALAMSRHLAAKNGVPAAQKQPAKLSPGEAAVVVRNDANNYVQQPDGTFKAVTPDGYSMDAEPMDGQMVVVPKSAADVDLIPDGTPYVVIQDKRRTVKVKPMDGLKKIASAEEAEIEIRTEAEKLANARVPKVAAYIAALEAYETKKTESPQTTPKPPLRPSFMPADADPQAFLADAPLPDELARAEREYYGKKGLTKQKADNLRIAHAALAYQRVIRDGRTTIRMPEGGTVAAQTVNLGGRNVSLPVPSSATEALAVIGMNGPHLTFDAKGNPRAVAHTDHPTESVDALTDWIDENFGTLPDGEKIAVRRVLWQTR